MEYDLKTTHFKGIPTLILRVCFIWILIAFKRILCTEEKIFKSLELDVTLYNEVLFHSQVALYSLEKLHPNMTYEIRVSYPATVPTEFTIRVYPPNHSSSFKSRHLMNIEKSTFKTDSATQGYVAEIIAHRIGLPYNQDRLKDPVVFNLVLETLYFGLSFNSWKMICYAVVLCVVSFKFLVPAIQHCILEKVSKYKH